MKKIKFETPNQMVNWLMDNEGKQLDDEYGRKWKYVNYSFYFRDIGRLSKYKEGIRCLHLNKEPFKITKIKNNQESLFY